MHIRTICVLGGSGFVGKQLVARLTTLGYSVKVLVRNRERAKEGLIILPTVDVVQVNDFSAAGLQPHFAGMDAVINLAGVLHGGKSVFARVHVDLVRDLISAARAAGVRRLLQMSALHASPDAPSEYLRSKAEGEALVLAAGQAAKMLPIPTLDPGILEVTVFRPSVIYGEGDHFLSLFSRLMDVLPALFLASPNARLQPVYVQDVVSAFANSLENDATFGKAYNLCGPNVYTLKQLVEMVREARQVDTRVIGLGDELSYLQALVLEHLPGKLLTRDSYRTLSVDQVCQDSFPAVLGVTPRPLEVELREYLGHDPLKDKYFDYRGRARR